MRSAKGLDGGAGLHLATENAIGYLVIDDGTGRIKCRQPVRR
jgi:hypothetical protein